MCSEDNRTSGNAERGAAQAQRMTESNAINKSLFVLANVINAINAGEVPAHSHHTTPHHTTSCWEDKTYPFFFFPIFFFFFRIC